VTQDKRGVMYWVVVAAGLAVLVYANYFLRSTLETAGEYMYNFYRYFYKDAAAEVFGPDYPKWRLLLPIPSMTGSWSPTTLVMMHFVTDWLSPARAWFLTNAIAIVVSFFLSWSVFHSRVFSFTLAICMGFGTQLYYVYPNSGLIAFPLYFCYLQALLLTSFRVVTAESRRVAWWVAFGVALVFVALAYEAWLDFLVFAWLATAVVGLLLWRRGQSLHLRRLVAVAAVMTAVGLLYIYLKVTLGYGQQRGMESDVVFNYPTLAPAVEDVISNGFLNLYMALTNFLPPMFVSSNAFYQSGGDQLVELQNGYHAPFNYLVPMQAMFQWRYYAGVAVTLFAFGLFRSVRAAWKRPGFAELALLVFMLMIAVGGPTHTFIKARPMNSMATQTYHVFVAVLGVSLVLSFVLMRAWQRWPRAMQGGLLVAGAWTVIFYSALTRPGMVSHQAANVGLGVQVYPNPMAKLKMLLGYTYPLPGGLQSYQLERLKLRAAGAPGEPAEAVRPLTPGPALSPLPNAAPPMSDWVLGAAARLEAVDNGWKVHGDNTAMGYQAISPAIAVKPHQRLLVRARGVNEAGRVCLGVLNAAQTGWVASPDVGQPEVAVETGTNTEVRLVFANCMTATVPENSRFVVYGVSYGFLDGPGGAGR